MPPNFAGGRCRIRSSALHFELVGGKSEDFDGDPADTVDAKGFGAKSIKVDNPAGDEWAAVDDPAKYLPAVRGIDDLNEGPEGKSFVSDMVYLVFDTKPLMDNGLGPGRAVIPGSDSEFCENLDRGLKAVERRNWLVASNLHRDLFHGLGSSRSNNCERQEHHGSGKKSH